MENTGTLAIDLGSSSTVVAYQPAGGSPELIALPPYSCQNPPLIPSLLWIASGEQAKPLIGRQVLDAGLARSNSPQLRRDFKRLIGSGGPGASAAEAAGALLLEQIWAAKPSEIKPQRLVLTAPIDTYRSYRHWLSQVCSQLDVAEVALVDEPTAAAIGAGLPPGSTVLVVDVGGGTVDLALVTLEGGEGRAAPIAQLLRFAGRDLKGSQQALRCARVIGKAGLAVGGRDLDHWIAAELCPHLPIEPDLLEAAERLKCLLSSQEEALVIYGPAGRPPLGLRMGRPQLEALLAERGLIDQLDGLLDQVLAAGRSAGITPKHITAVLPVGGSSQIPLLQQWIQQRLEGVPLRGKRPVEAVALGALALTPGVRLMDVLSHGVSLRCWDQRSNRHHWHPLFVPGQSWPTERPFELVLACSQEGQTSLEMHLGEPQNEQRGEVVFQNGLPVLRQRRAGASQVRAWEKQPAAIPLLPSGVQGCDRIRARLSINGAGQLSAQLHDLQTDSPLGERLLGLVR
ncbi:Hsp70 family protein [Cyanobium sp. WAJ14-Wanaka]|uniref:Hsp70 family protein n=1 Tax=Cyanobium sp. WAJ14-Wanaka TaxID=2823725 RepID=UPI0020CC84EC|nr:Hsp70 family protein [Cyanobium sp. WAJ14-Wanaka]MCP9775195.1 Hsp70 family protein [Cyanobium sp. WAJ14-Wanaka]